MSLYGKVRIALTRVWYVLNGITRFIPGKSTASPDTSHRLAGSAARTWLHARMPPEMHGP